MNLNDEIDWPILDLGYLFYIDILLVDLMVILNTTYLIDSKELEFSGRGESMLPFPHDVN
jgi:hypothetical protein